MLSQENKKLSYRLWIENIYVITSYIVIIKLYSLYIVNFVNASRI